MVSSIGIVGGSGPLGRGLAGRFAQVGLDVALGSRVQQRALDAVAKVVARLDEAEGASGMLSPPGSLTGGVNADVLDRDLVVLALPATAIETTLPPLASRLAGRLVVSAANPLAFDAAGPRPDRVPAGSAAQTVASLLPDARVTAAFHTLSSAHLRRLAEPMDDDVPVVGDDPSDVATVVQLVDRLAGLRGVAAGPLRLAAPLEDLTAVLIAINRGYSQHVGVRFSRLATGGGDGAD